MSKMKYYTVYKITNTVNNMIYIGYHTTTNLNDSYMGSGRYIKEAITEFGIDNFVKEILFVFDNKHDMLQKEKEIVDDVFRRRLDTYNVALGGNGFGMLGVKLSKDTRDKMSKSRTGKKRTFSESHRLHISESKKNRKQTPEQIERRIAPLRGRKKRPLSDDIKQKISNTKLQSPCILTEEQRSKISKRMRGRIWIFNMDLKCHKLARREDIDMYLMDGWKIGRTKF